MTAALLRASTPPRPGSLSLGRDLHAGGSFKRQLVSQPGKRLGAGAAPPRATRGCTRRAPLMTSTAALRTGIPAPAPRSRDSWLLETIPEEVDWMDQRDERKEPGRRFMRSINTFTHDRWTSHRSVDRYWRHMRGIFNSNIVAGLAFPLACVTGTSLAVCAYETLRESGALPAWLPSLVIPTPLFDLTSFALSLLLVFRTTTSYERWEEAADCWGLVANRSRDCIRQLITYLSCEGGESCSAVWAKPHGGACSTTSATGSFSCSECGNSGHCSASSGSLPWPLAVVTARWIVAFSRSLKGQVTEDTDLKLELADILSAQELDLLLSSHHRPSFALSVLTELLAVAPLREFTRARIDENLTSLEDAVGLCERLLRTPIPLSYTRHTSRFMVVWLSLLPLGLWESCGWGSVIMSAVIAFPLLGIEEIGVQIEEPFGILPLEDICTEVEGDLFSLLEEAPRAKQTAAAAASAALADVEAARQAVAKGASQAAPHDARSSARSAVPAPAPAPAPATASAVSHGGREQAEQPGRLLISSVVPLGAATAVGNLMRQLQSRRAAVDAASLVQPGLQPAVDPRPMTTVATAALATASSPRVKKACPGHNNKELCRTDCNGCGGGHHHHHHQQQHRS